MDNKFIRYCLVEPKCRLRMAVLFLLIALIVGQMWYRGTQNVTLSALEAKGIVIARTSGMERELKTMARLEAFRNEKNAALGNTDLTKIGGVAMHGGKPSVLIDGTVYAEGGSFGEYVIVHITPEMITLVNTKTNARKNLYVFE